MRRDMPLAEKDFIEPADLRGQPLIVPRQHNHNVILSDMIGLQDKDMNIKAEYNLVYNGSVMAGEGIGYCITFDKLINTEGSNMCFKPIVPKVEAVCTFVWKRYTVFTKAASLFLEQFKKDIAEYRT